MISVFTINIYEILKFYHQLIYCFKLDIRVNVFSIKDI